MKIEEIKKIAVIGAGTMGSQIADICSRVGNYQVTMVDATDDLVRKGIQVIEDRLETYFVSRDKMTPEEKKKIMERITGGKSIEEAVSDANFVIEAVFESMDVKKDVYRKLDTAAPPDAILASNTSQLNITEIASATDRLGKVVGMHFFNPVAVMKLVEVVRGSYTSDETIDVTCALARKLGKEPVVCRDASYGFLANRAYTAMLREAVQMVWERVANPGEIDKALKLGYNLPMGPLELFDFTGAWATLGPSEADAIRELGEEKGRLHPLIRMMLRAGYKGGQGGKGIYDFWNDVLAKY